MRESGNSRRRRYTNEEREKILRDAEEFGVGEAARRHEMSESTVFSWRHRLRGKAEGSSSPASEPPSSRARSDEAPVADGRDGGAEQTVGGAAEKKPRSPARSYTPSEKAQALELAATSGVSDASRTLGMSRFSIYAWQRQAKKSAAGEGPSPTSGPAPAEIEEQRDREILAEWKQHPGLGPSQVRNQLRRHGIKVSVQTARRVMEDAGYRPPKVKREKHDKRYEAVRPNHLWHLDFVQR